MAGNLSATNEALLAFKSQAYETQEKLKIELSGRANAVKQKDYQIEELEGQVKSCNNEIGINQDRIKLLNQEIDKLNVELTARQRGLSDSGSVITSLRNGLAQKEDQMKKVSEANFDMEREIKSLEAEVENRNKVIASQKEDGIRMEGQIKQLIINTDKLT